MQALALVGVDRPPAEPRIGRALHAPAVARAGLGQIAGQRRFDRADQLLLPLRRILLGVGEDAGELGRRITNARPERKDRGPALGGGGLFVEALMELGDADQRQEVGLVDPERALEGAAFGLAIAEDSLGRREVDPVRALGRLALAGNFEMGRGGRRVGPCEGLRAKPVAGRRFRLVDRERGLEMGSRLVDQARLAGALRVREMLLNAAGRHNGD